MRPARNKSKQRDAILSCIQGTVCHPTAHWVYDRLKPEIPGLSLGTVYRNLSILRQDGQIQSVGFNGGMEHFDGDLHPHAHFFCTVCGRVSDLMDIEIPPAPQVAEGEVEAVSLCFHGKCHHCKKETYI